MAVIALAALVLGTAPAPADPPPPPRTHVVSRGDTLGGIAARYHVSVAALVAANRLPGQRAVLRIGQRLALPALSSPAARSVPATVTSPHGSASAPRAAAAPVAIRPAAGRRGGPARPPVVPRGPRGLELTVPDFVDGAPAFVWPVEGPITSTFGRRRSAWHRGIDIKAERGSVVYAAAAGVVVTSNVEPRYGRVVKIEHDDGFVTVYAHNDENLVQPGTKVAAGDPVAIIGRTGRATSEHLHFEIRRNGAVYNPLYLLPLPPRVAQVEETDEPTEEEHD